MTQLNNCDYDKKHPNPLIIYKNYKLNDVESIKI